MGKLPPLPPPKNREEMLQQIAEIERRYSMTRVRIYIVIMLGAGIPLGLGIFEIIRLALVQVSALTR